MRRYLLAFAIVAVALTYLLGEMAKIIEEDERFAEEPY